MLRKLALPSLAAAVANLLLVEGIITAALVQTVQAEFLRVSGASVIFDSPALTVETLEGQTLNIGLPQGGMISSVARAAITEIKTSDYVGIASTPRAVSGCGTASPAGPRHGEGHVAIRGA